MSNGNSALLFTYLLTQSCFSQLHWNNPLHHSHHTDSSGFKFYLTPNLRPNNAGVLMVGQLYLAIPPMVTAHHEIGSCGSDCTPEIMTGEVYVTQTFNHMHLLGNAHPFLYMYSILIFTRKQDSMTLFPSLLQMLYKYLILHISILRF